MTLRKHLRRALFSALFLWPDCPAEVTPQASARQYEIYSNVRDREGDLEGTEIDLFLWEDRSVEATLTVYRRLVETHPVRLRGTWQDDDVSLSLSRDDETLEIRATRSADRFTGQMIYRRNGKVVRTDPLNLPRKKLKS